VVQSHQQQHQVIKKRKHFVHRSLLSVIKYFILIKAVTIEATFNNIASTSTSKRVLLIGNNNISTTDIDNAVKNWFNF